MHPCRYDGGERRATPARSVRTRTRRRRPGARSPSRAAPERVRTQRRNLHSALLQELSGCGHKRRA
eukprot:6203892-Pleurochrysis_carterae.AAC.6